jgi:transcriptional regulator with GAF, ATPase, and Fis domain/tetratricopeptide (TPR) repeat protein
LALPASPLSLVSASGARAFVDLDERIVAGQAGVVIVRAREDVHAPLVAHAARRLRTSGWSPIEASVRAGAPLVREIASQLGLGALPCEPTACAEAIAQAATVKRAAIVAPLPKEGTWDRTVVSELARVGKNALIVLVCAGDVPAWDATIFEIGGELTASDKLRWLSAVAEEAQVDLPASDLRALEAWWTQARHVVPLAAPSLDGLDDTARALLTCLALAGRSLPLASLALYGDDALDGIDRLVAAGAASRHDSFVAMAPSCDARAIESSATDADRLAVSRILAGGPGFDPDPWAYARAAELLVGAGAIDAADAAIAKAMRKLDDPQAAGEIGQRWFACVAPIAGDAGITLRVRAAERALAGGEANDALRWCEAAQALRPGEPQIGLLMGRALMQLGDLVASRVALQKAFAAAADDEMRSRVASEVAEVNYLAGDLDKAAEQAQRTIDLAATTTTRLAGRNTLGKILLARGAWEQADEHFAEDALVASAGGETLAELRARLNRAIALMSRGRRNLLDDTPMTSGLDDARMLLERVLTDGAACGADRACAHAFTNLGVIAYRQHDFAAALSHWEAASRFPQALRGRIASARTLANLGELRLQLGLVDHAEHAVAFGRRVLGGRSSAAAASHFGAVAARIALVRGNSALARREIDTAIADAQSANDVGDRLWQAFTVSARVALEDGDVHRAAEDLSAAEKCGSHGRALAEIALVRALHLRALGQNAIDAANAALASARTSGESDLLAEIHSLLAVLHRDCADLQAAQAHCCRAVAVRDHIAASLPGDIRTAFLAKPEMVSLARLQTALASHDVETVDEAPRTPIPSRVEREGNGNREIIGDDPQIRSLLVAIRKVAKSNSTVLIRGESGTGKELVADALHRASDRANGPLVSVNCAALVETLLLSELFGHEKGAFTGAAARRRGRFELAEGGTLFLDEIGDISARTQVALLRVLQEKTFERVGGTTPIRANVRVICATHRDLKAMVDRGEFREDLYYRLRGITLEVPALRARIADLPKIADHLLGRIAVERGDEQKSLAQDATELLQRHRWPGNIRELENVLRAVSLFAEGAAITASDLIENVDDLRSLAQSGPSSQPPISLRSVPPPPSTTVYVDGAGDEGDDSEGMLPDGEANATAVAYHQVRQGAVSLSDMKRQIERDCIARALVETKGNITRAAALLGMKRPRLSQLVKQYGLSATSEGGQ